MSSETESNYSKHDVTKYKLINYLNDLLWRVRKDQISESEKRGLLDMMREINFKN